MKQAKFAYSPSRKQIKAISDAAEKQQMQLNIESKNKSQTEIKNQSPICFQKTFYYKKLYMD